MDYGKLCGFLIYVLRKKMSVNKDGTILFEPHQNASIFKSYCSELYTVIVNFGAVALNITILAYLRKKNNKRI